MKASLLSILLSLLTIIVSTWLADNFQKHSVAIPLPPIQVASLPTNDIAHAAAHQASQTMRFLGQIGGTINKVVLQDDFAYLAIGPRLVILDLASPNNAVLLGQTDALPDIVRSVAISESHAYLAMQNHGLWIFNLTDPTNPIRVKVYKPATSFYVSNVAVKGNYAYVTGSFGFHILDITDPANTTRVGEHSISGHLLQVSGNRVYVGITNGFHIIDVSNPEAPITLGQHLLAAGWVSDILVWENHVFLAASSGGLRIIDVSSPSAPVEVGFFGEVSNARRITRASNYIYLVGGGSGIHTIDVSNPAVPREVGFYRPLRGISPESSMLTYVRYNDFVMNNDQAATTESGGFLHVMGLKDHLWPYPITTFETVGNTRAVAVKGDLLYVASGDPGLGSGLHVINVSKTKGPSHVSSYNLPGDASGIAAKGNIAYVADGWLGLTVVDISNPDSLAVIGSHLLGYPGRANDIVISGNYAYIAGGANGLVVIDISNPITPITVGSYNMAGTALTLEVMGSYAYVASSSGGLHIISITDPVNPIEVGVYFPPQYPLDVVVAGSHAYVASGAAGLRIVDVSNPTTPLEVSYYSSMYVSGIAVNNHYAYLIGGQNELHTLDVSNPAAPVNVGVYGNIPGLGAAVVSDASNIYAAMGNGGLVMLDHLSSVSVSVPSGGASLISMSDGVSYSFSANTFTETAIVSHTPLARDSMLLPNDVIEALRIFDAAAVYESNGQAALPTKPFTITVDYTGVAAADENTLAFYFWNGTVWVEEPSSEIDAGRKTVTATPEHFSPWLLGKAATHRVNLPLVMNRYAPIDLSIAAIEVTQAIQDLDNNVPLVTNRPTVARIYAQTASALPVKGVHLSLSAYREGASLPGSPIIMGPWTVFPDISRDSYANSFNIPLPTGWLSGQVTLIAEVNPFATIPEANQANNSKSTTVNFYSVPPLSVKVVPVNYTYSVNGTTCPGPPPIDIISDWLMRSFPLSNVDVAFRAPINFTGDLRLREESVRLLQEITTVKHMDGAPPSQVYYGAFTTLNSSGEQCPIGVGGLGWIGQRASIGVAPSLVTSLNQLRLSDQAQLAAHEIGHNFGLLHAPCGVSGAVDPNYPYVNASIGQFGFDVFRNRVWSPVYPDYAKDVMSYCGPQWFSDYHYYKLYVDQLAHGLSQAQPTESLLVRIVFADNDAPSLLPIYSFPSLAKEETVEESMYHVELIDVNGDVIVTYFVPNYEVAHPDIDERRIIYASIPRPSEPVSSLRLINSSTEIILAEWTIESYPIVTRLTPIVQREEATNILLVRWGMPDVPVLVRYTFDNGQTWLTVDYDISTGELQLDPASLPEGNGYFEVRPALSFTSGN